MALGRGGVPDDAEVFRQLYPSLRRFAAFVASAEIEPDDLVQEAVTKTLARHRLADLDEPGAYLRRVIFNLAANGRRRRQPLLRAQSRVAEHDGQVQPMPSDLAELERLTPLDRAVMWLVHIEGFSHREAASLLDLTEQASRSRSSRAVRQLRSALSSEETS